MELLVSLSDGAAEALRAYGASVDKSPSEIAAIIIESALLHFLAGKIVGLDAAKEIYRS